MRPLTSDQIEVIRLAILDSYAVHAIKMFGAQAIPKRLLSDLVKRRVITKQAAQAISSGMLGDAWLWGNQWGKATAGAVVIDPVTGHATLAPGGSAQPPPYPTPPGDVPPPGWEARTGPPEIPPLTSWEKHMAAAARSRGADLVVGLGNRVAADFTTVAISSDNAAARRYKAIIRESVAETIEARKGWRYARGEIGEQTNDYSRDLDRIAFTEVAAAVNEGYGDALAEELGPGQLVSCVPNPGACPNCVRLYLGKDGKPKIFNNDTLPSRAVNFKVKAANWVATVPPLHPHCGCTKTYVPKGWGYADDWTLLPESMLPAEGGPGLITPNAEARKDAGNTPKP